MIDKKYLPSKNFVIKVSILIAIFLAIFGVYKLIIYIKNVNQSKESTILVKDLIQKDTNGNGIADWEESLWGFDPTKDGEENKKAIDLRKKELAIQNPSDQNQKMTESNLLVREFITIAMALEQEGKLNQASMSSLTSIVGQKLDPKPIEDKYTSSNQNIVPDTEANKKAYFVKMKSLLEKYKDVGTELFYISESIKNNDATALRLAKNIGVSYQKFADEFIKVPVPSKLADVSLRITNSYYKIGVSIETLSEFFNDSLVGMRAFINYKSYMDQLYTEIEELSSIV
jgi:hypothetical protein